MKILDATAGYRGIWYQKNHPYVTFMDVRKGTIDTKSINNTFKTRRRIKINPDVVSEWKDAPFSNDYFDMVIFDPPHFVIERGKKVHELALKYGYFYKDNYRQILQEGIRKLFDVLKPDGVFILKWCEDSVPVDEILKLMPYPPLFGSNVKKRNYNETFWIVFLKYRPEIPFDFKLGEE